MWYTPGMADKGGIRSKGYTLKGALAYVVDRHGDEALKRVLDVLDGDLASLLASRVVPSEWYPFEYQVRFYEAVDRVLGRGDLSLCWQIGRFTAEFELTTIHKIFMKVGGPRRLLSLSGMLWNRYYSVGKLDVQSLDNRGAKATVRDFHPISRAFCFDLAGWMERTLELSGGKDIHLVHSECVIQGANACVYEGSWSE